MSTTIEESLIAAVLRSKNLTLATGLGVSKESFTSYADQWDWIERFFHRHNKTPSRQAFLTQFPGFGVIARTQEVEHYAKEILKHHATRDVTSGVKEVLDHLTADEHDLAIEALEKTKLLAAGRLAGASAPHESFGDWQASLDDAAGRYERAQAGMVGISTGIQSLDIVTAGYQPGWFVVVAARSGIGKSNCMIKSAWEAALRGYKVAYFSMEMSKFQISTRMHAYASRQFWNERTGNTPIYSLDLMHGRIKPHHYREFLEHLETKVSGKFYVYDTSRGGMNVNKIEAQIVETKPDIVFVDYMQLLQNPNPEQDWRGIAANSGALKVLAEKSQIPFIVGSQRNRSANQAGKPGLESLSQGDTIGHDADLVLMLEKPTDSVVQIDVTKFRHGPSGRRLYCHVDPNKGLYKEIQQDEVERLRAADVVED